MDNGRHEDSKGRRQMRVFGNNWNPIETAPLDKDVTLEVTDGRGAPYSLPNPCRRITTCGCAPAAYP
jgi:hypothetical protein